MEYILEGYPMFKRLVCMLSLTFLLGCNGEEEVAEEQIAEEVEETEDGTETEVNEGEDEEGSEEETETSLPDPVIVEQEIYSHSQGTEVTIQAEVGPILVENGQAVLPIVFDNLSETAIRLTEDVLSNQFVPEDLAIQSDVRLIDAQERTVSHLSIYTYERDGEQGTSFNAVETVLGTGSRNDKVTIGPDDDPTYFYAAFEAPTSEEVHVLIQTLGLVENVPVVNREDIEVPTVAEATETLENEGEVEGNHAYGVPTVLEIMEQEMVERLFEQVENTYPENVYARTMPLETYRESVETSVSRVDEIEHSTLILSADVLFEFDEASLSEEADQELEAAIAELEGVEGGELEIVGHTDDNGTEEYNQELSEDRAASVENRLSQLTDLEQFDTVNVRGEAFREPIADNETEAGQAQNRRVELHFTPPVEQVVVESEGDFPEVLGVDVEYPDTANVEEGQVEIQSLRRVDDFLVGRIKVQPNEGELSRHALQAFGTWSLTGARGRSYRDAIGFDSSRIYTLSILHGDQRYYPIDYYMSTIPGTLGEERVEDAENGEEVEDVDYIIPLAERVTSQMSSPEEEAYYVATVIWPVVEADEVAVELSMPDVNLVSDDLYDTEVESIQPWRILNVPVEETTD